MTGPGQYPPVYSIDPGTPQPAAADGFAVASLVLGIVWVFWLGSILAVIFAFVSIGRARRAGQRPPGVAVAGMVLGWVGAASLLWFIIVAALGAAGGAS